MLPSPGLVNQCPATTPQGKLNLAGPIANSPESFALAADGYEAVDLRWPDSLESIHRFARIA